MLYLYVLGVILRYAAAASVETLTALSQERMVFQTDFGVIEMAFYPKVYFEATCWFSFSQREPDDWDQIVS